MVVGTGSYKDKAEAFPLDKKTLNQIALRSFFVGSSLNGETAESVGWTWAMMPGLKKIHTNEEDLALSMGHNLEFVKTGSFFSTFAMGVTLAMEQEKMDLETIRTVRTATAAASDALSTSVFTYLLLPFAAAAVAAGAEAGNVMMPVLFFVLLALVTVALRFVLMKVGYSRGIKAAEKLIKHQAALKDASRTAGIFLIGAMIVYYGRHVVPGITYANTGVSSASFLMASSFNGILPGLTCLLVTWMSYHLLTKKNWSLAKVIILILVIGLCGAFFGFWAGGYTTPIAWPWMA